MRDSLLGRDPDIHPVTLAVLAAVAGAIERESVERYQALAAAMERRGEAETAAAFRVMLDEERKHVEAVERWAASIGQSTGDAARFRWRLPADLSSSWDDVMHSAALTPYRAFAIAVDNEQRAFAFYSYLASAADDARVAAEAERLASEELRHAALMRRWRRQAWHREGRALHHAEPPVVSADMLHAVLAQHEAAILACQHRVAARLRALGDDDSARVVEQVAASPSWPAAASEATASSDEAALDDDVVHLLVAAQAPLEMLANRLEDVLKTTEGELFAEAERAVVNVVGRIGQLSLQVERRMGTS